MISEFHEVHCVLTSSGRAAIRLCFEAMGLSRYNSTIAAPRMISRCVLDVLVRFGFPLDASAAQSADACLRYHQYGVAQADFAHGPRYLDDVCHAFFWSGNRGGKGWAGDFAAFSLPKFFATRGMAGGLLVKDAALAEALRARRDASAPPTPEARRREAQIFAAAYEGDPAHAEDLEHLYLQRTLRLRCNAEDLCGMPARTRAMRDTRARRAEILERLVTAAPARLLPPGWPQVLAQSLPFALPLFFSDAAERDKAGAAVAALGMLNGVYTIDKARRQAAPQPARALLIPCHDEIADVDIEALAGVLSRLGDAPSAGS